MSLERRLPLSCHPRFLSKLLLKLMEMSLTTPLLSKETRSLAGKTMRMLKSQRISKKRSTINLMITKLAMNLLMRLILSQLRKIQLLSLLRTILVLNQLLKNLKKSVLLSHPLNQLRMKLKRAQLLLPHLLKKMVIPKKNQLTQHLSSPRLFTLKTKL